METWYGLGVWADSITHIFNFKLLPVRSVCLSVRPFSYSHPHIFSLTFLGAQLLYNLSDILLSVRSDFLLSYYIKYFCLTFKILLTTERELKLHRGPRMVFPYFSVYFLGLFFLLTKYWGCYSIELTCNSLNYNRHLFRNAIEEMWFSQLLFKIDCVLCKFCASLLRDTVILVLFFLALPFLFFGFI